MHVSVLSHPPTPRNISSASSWQSCRTGLCTIYRSRGVMLFRLQATQVSSLCVLSRLQVQRKCLVYRWLAIMCRGKLYFTCGHINCLSHCVRFHSQAKQNNITPARVMSHLLVQNKCILLNELYSASSFSLGTTAERNAYSHSNCKRELRLNSFPVIFCLNC